MSLSAKNLQVAAKAEIYERYTFGEQIAKGGMGKILSAKDNQLERQVAVKQPLDTSADSSQIRQIIREAQITARLAHPGIVPIHELGRDSRGNIYYTMKHVHGETLEKVLEKIRESDPGMLEKCPFQRLLVIFSRVCDTIGYANEMGIIHRDIKPENVMLAPFGEYLVIDWGIAKDLKSPQPTGTEDIAPAFRHVPEEGDFGATVHGSIFGTPSYMSPEQARGDVDKIDARTDVFALGALLFEILTLSPPYVGESPEAVVKLAENREIQKISEIRRRRINDPRRSRRSPALNPWPHLKGTEIPESLLAVALKAMRLDPAERYQTATEVRQDIDAYLAGHTTKAENADFSKIVRLAIIRHKAITSVLAAGLVLAGIAAGFTARINSQETRKATLAMSEAETYVARTREEREQRRQTRLEVAPNYVEMARLLANRGETEDALKVARLATEYNPALPEATALLKALEIALRLDAPAAGAESTPQLVDFPALQYLLDNPELLPKNQRMGLSEQIITRLTRAWSEVGLSRLSGELTAQQTSRFAAYQGALQKAWQKAGAEWKLSLAPAISGLCFDTETIAEFPGYTSWAAEADRDHPGQLLHLEITGGAPDLSILATFPIESIRIHSGTTFSQTQLAPLARCRYLKVLVLEGGTAGDLSFLKDLPLFAVKINNQASALDLSGLGNCRSLRVLWTGLENDILSLSPLSRCARLQFFSGSAHNLDYSPLAGLPIQFLEIRSGETSPDLSALSDLPVQTFVGRGIDLQKNWKPLSTWPLQSLTTASAHWVDLSQLSEPLPHLETLRIQKGNWTGEPASLFPGLKILFDETAHDFPTFASLPSLVEIWIEGNQDTICHLSSLEQIPAEKELHIGYDTPVEVLPVDVALSLVKDDWSAADVFCTRLQQEMENPTHPVGRAGAAARIVVQQLASAIASREDLGEQFVSRKQQIDRRTYQVVFCGQTRAQAGEFAKKAGGTLATIRSGAVRDFLTQIARKSPSYQALWVDDPAGPNAPPRQATVFALGEEKLPCFRPQSCVFPFVIEWENAGRGL